jgi:hypothetical protein
VASVAEMGCAAIAALCLRTPDNAAAFVANGVGQLVVDILKTHKLKVGVEVSHKSGFVLSFRLGFFFK